MDPGSVDSPSSEINVTPLVDVMLVVLIISMLVTPLLQQGRGVHLPDARNVETVPNDNERVLTVTVEADGQTFLGANPVEMARLRQVMAMRYRKHPATRLRIKADRQVRYGVVKQVIRVGRQAGFSGASLVAEERKQKDEIEGG